MASGQTREELDQKAWEHLAEGRSRGARSKGGQTRKVQLGTEWYKEKGRKGWLSTMDKSGGKRACPRRRR